MRKILASSFVAAFALTLAGCGDDRKNSIPTVDPNAKPPKLIAGGTGDTTPKKAPAAPTSTDK
jgi:predicted small lipoprotein YifL